MGIVTSGLVGYWNSKQGVAGTTWQNIAPATPGKYNATLVGGTVVQASGMYFDGVDDKATFPKIDEVQTTAGDFSYELRMKLDNYTQSPDILATIEDGYSIMYVDNTSITIGTFNGVNAFNQTLVFNNTMTNGTEYYISVTYKHSTKEVTLYINGNFLETKLANSSYSGYLLPPTKTMRMSNSAFPQPKGYIDNFRIYNKVLTQTEITQNYNNGTAVGLSSGTAYTKSLSDSFSLSETFTKVTSRYKTVNESITLSETVTKLYSGFKTINDAITSAETFAKQFAGYKSLSDSVPSSDSISRQFTGRKTVNDSISSSDSISKSFTATIIDSIATGDAENEQSSKLLNDILSSADSVSSTKGKAVNLSDSIAITETIRKALAKIQSDSISSTDVDSESINRQLNDAIASTDSITTFKGKTVTLSDSITLTDALNKAISSLKIDSVGLSENFGKTSAVSVRVYDVIISTDHLDTFLPNVPTYNEVIQLTLEIAQGKTVNLAIVERGNYELDVVERKTIDIKL